MDPETFVRIVRMEVLQGNLRHYKEVLETQHPPGSVNDPYWNSILSLYNRLDEAGRTAMQNAMHLVLLDTLANLLGILDGTCLLAEYRQDFHLTYGDDPTLLNQDLADLFLAADEESPITM